MSATPALVSVEGRDMEADQPAQPNQEARHPLSFFDTTHADAPAHTHKQTYTNKYTHNNHNITHKKISSKTQVSKLMGLGERVDLGNDGNCVR